MTSSVKRPNFINSILQALLVVSILGFVLSAAWMFMASNVGGVSAYGSIAVYCLLNSVGVTLIRRWHKAGAWICLIASLAECSSLKIWGWVFLLSATSAACVPYIIVGCIFMIIVIPLFVLKAQPSGRIIWKEMKGGMDVKHTRHIYQLTSLLTAGVIATMIFYKPSDAPIAQPAIDITDTDDKVALQRIVDYTLLDSVNVTLNEIAIIESMFDSIPIESRMDYDKRIFALKHVLVSGLMTDKHNTLNLKNICKIHTGEFSKEQQRVLDWYLDLPQEKQEVWLDCPSVDNLSDFEKEVKQRITPQSK